MKAIIFNSGLGSRLGELTADRPKCLVRLGNGETILHRQLRVLSSCGVRDFVITTGPFPELVEAEARTFEDRGCTFAFVRNDVYDQTNYLWSMWLARNQIAGRELLLLHGDLVFDAAYVSGLLALPAGSYGSVDPALPLPEKDFKARIVDGEVREVGVNTWGEGCVAFQALYRLSPAAVDTWLAAVGEFAARGETGVYAENAANTVFGLMHVAAHPYTGHVVEEIDTPEDLARVSALIEARDYADQPVLELRDGRLAPVMGACPAGVDDLSVLLASLRAHRPLVVADAFVGEDLLDHLLDGCAHETFRGFAANPTYEQVLDAVRLFRERGCDSLVSVGGGSAIDVAKCVKLFAPMAGDGLSPRFVDLPRSYSPLPHVAVPTTAGTGSESTHFAVLYVDGVKNSITQPCLQPDAAVLDASLLASLPPYQRRATLLDALAQAVESHWSRRSDDASRAYSSEAIPAIMANAPAYLDGDADAAREVMRAANLAGKAINLTTTTAAHAMSYKLTSLYGAAHGHAVALCLPFCWHVLLERGDAVTQEHLAEVARLMCGRADASPADGLVCFEALCDVMGIAPTIAGDPADLDLLADSVNVERLGNFPVTLGRDELWAAYAAIVTPANRTKE